MRRIAYRADGRLITTFPMGSPSKHLYFPYCGHNKLVLHPQYTTLFVTAKLRQSPTSHRTRFEYTTLFSVISYDLGYYTKNLQPWQILFLLRLQVVLFDKFTLCKHFLLTFAVI